MRARSKTIDRKQLPLVLLIIATMAVLTFIVQFDRRRHQSGDIRAKAYQQSPKGVRIEAEEMTLSGISRDASGTSISFVEQSQSTTQDQCPPVGQTPAGVATIDIDLNISANYHPWVLMKSVGDSANTVWFQLDNLVCSRVGDMNGSPSGVWDWVGYQNGDSTSRIPSPIIGTGHHLLRLYGNSQELGVAVDKVLLVIDASCVPTGNGDACDGISSTPTPTPSPTPPPTPKKNSVNSPQFVTSTLPKAIRGQQYSATIVATDTTIQDTLGMFATKLPTGITLSSCMQTADLGGTSIQCPLSGVSTEKGTFNPQFTVLDSSGNQTVKTMKLQIQ